MTGMSLVILSDRALGPDRVPISALLACGAVHHHLVGQTKRTRIGIVLETGEAREVHHHCLLIGYGADAINPYLAFEALWRSRRKGLLPEEMGDDALVTAYRKGVAKGMLKVMAKMGISTLQSYKGAQIFEAIGLHDEVIDRCFAGTASRIQGVGFDVLAEELLRRHAIGYPAARCLPGEGSWPIRASSIGAPVVNGTPGTRRRSPTMQIAARTNRRRGVSPVRRVGQSATAAPDAHSAACCSLSLRPEQAIPIDRGRTGQRDCQAVLHRRDEFRFHLR